MKWRQLPFALAAFVGLGLATPADAQTSSVPAQSASAADTDSDEDADTDSGTVPDKDAGVVPDKYTSNPLADPSVDYSLSVAAANGRARGLPPYQGPRWRYQNMGLFQRLAFDIPAFPATVVDWTPAEWLGFGAIITPGIVLMLPLNPSLDAQFETWVETSHDPFWDTVLPDPTDTAMTIGTLAYVGVYWVSGWISQDETVLELASLSSESLALGQLYHVTLKVMIGREGPLDGNGSGTVHGPTTRWFPNGTPSGHMATTTSLLAIYGEYYDNWAMRGGAIAVSTWMAAMLMYSGQHFFSDIIWGGALGWATASWVVRHRSTRWVEGEDGFSKYVAILPMPVDGGGGGLQLAGTW